MKYCNIYLLTFLITGIYDLILQLSINGYIPLLANFLKNSDWYISLKDYFKRHTPLSAILLAGFIGFITQIIIFNIIYLKNINIDILGLIHSNNRMLMLLNIIKFLVISFIISGLIGIPIKMSNLFPILEEKKEDKFVSHVLSESDKNNIRKMIDILSIKEIVTLISQNNNLSKKDIYNYCLSIKNEK